MGPNHWRSADQMRRSDWSGMSALQIQQEEESLLQTRRMELDIIENDTSTLVVQIANVFTESLCVGRELAAQVLKADVIQQLLDLDSTYRPEVGGALPAL